MSFYIFNRCIERKMLASRGNYSGSSLMLHAIGIYTEIYVYKTLRHITKFQSYN